MKRTSFVVRAVGWALVAWAAGSAGAMPAQGATAPDEPWDFSAGFTATADIATLQPLLQQNPSVSWQAGVETGNFYEDFTDKRVRIDFLDPDGTPQQTAFQFFDKLRQYLYVYPTGTCTESTLGGTMTPFFAFLASAKPAGVTGKGANRIDLWRYRNPSGSAVKETDLSVTHEPPNAPLSMEWWIPLPVWLKFTSFTSGRPDASVFNLPVACVD